MSNNFTGITFAHQKVTPADDATVRHALFDDCILTGCALSYVGSTLTVAPGYLMICGRQIRIPASMSWSVLDATAGFARIVISVDLTRTATKTAFEQVYTSVEYASAQDGFPALTQTDINQTGSIYQVELCVVSLGVGGISAISREIPIGSSKFGLYGHLPISYNADVNDFLACGHYAAADDNIAKSLINSPVENAFTMEVRNAMGTGVPDIRLHSGTLEQVLRCPTFGVTIRRYITRDSAGNFSYTPWEWDNPLMLCGVEYRTAERWNGKAVYCKLVDCGEATASMMISHVLGATAILRSAATCGSKSAPWIHFDDEGTIDPTTCFNVRVDTTFILVTVAEIYIGQHVYVSVWYTKD